MSSDVPYLRKDVIESEAALVLGGAASQAELCRKHNLKPQLLGQWKTAALERLHTLFQEDPQACQDQLRIAELEQLVGRQAYLMTRPCSRRPCSTWPANGPPTAIAGSPP